MLREVGEAIKTALSGTFKQIEFYEGQFERFDEEVVNPPALYIEWDFGKPAKNGSPLGYVELVLHVLTSRLERNPGNMLDILETIINTIHDKGLRDTSDNYLGHVFFKEFKNTIVHDGLVAFECRILVEKGLSAKSG